MKNEDDDLKNTALMSDILIKITAIEKIMISKGIITNDELAKEITIISRFVAKSMLKRARVTGDLDKIIDDLIEGKSEITS